MIPALSGLRGPHVPFADQERRQALGGSAVAHEGEQVTEVGHFVLAHGGQCLTESPPVLGQPRPGTVPVQAASGRLIHAHAV